MRSQRQLQVGEEIRHALAKLFQRGDVSWPMDFKDPMVTISEVQISPDLRNATVFFTTLDSNNIEETRKILNKTAGFFRHALAKAVRMRYVPNVRFEIDASFDYAQKIDTLLTSPEVSKDLAPAKEEGRDLDDLD